MLDTQSLGRDIGDHDHRGDVAMHSGTRSALGEMNFGFKLV